MFSSILLSEIIANGVIFTSAGAVGRVGREQRTHRKYRYIESREGRRYTEFSLVFILDIYLPRGESAGGEDFKNQIRDCAPIRIPGGV